MGCNRHGAIVVVHMHERGCAVVALIVKQTTTGLSASFQVIPVQTEDTVNRLVVDVRGKFGKQFLRVDDS